MKYLVLALFFTFLTPNLIAKTPRLVMFLGVDISGSFKKTKYYKDSLDFAAHYIYAHIHGIEGLKQPHALFVGSIGGAKPDEPKTFYPIQNFKYKSIPQIKRELRKIFPNRSVNPMTDYNAFFHQISTYVQNKKLIMKPLSIVLLTDGIPDAPKKNNKDDYRSFDLSPLENLSRNVTLRVLYTSASTGLNWQTKVPRKRVRIWTQDAKVMEGWKAQDIMVPGRKFEKQDRFFSWIKDNVDFPVRVKRVD